MVMNNTSAVDVIIQAVLPELKPSWAAAIPGMQISSNAHHPSTAVIKVFIRISLCTLK
jgi:hypothetical protein